MLKIQRTAERKFVILTECPLCGYEFAPEERRHIHLRDHSPDDFGLAPLGEVNEEAQKPLWDSEPADLAEELGPDPQGFNSSASTD